MATLLFYDNPVPLNAKTHRNVRIRPSDEGLKFSSRTNSVLLAGIEFPEACKHFPIAFARIGENQLLPVALLGFRDAENLFVDAGGKWKGEYVPAFIRRYPFVLGRGDANGPWAVCIDESFSGFGADEGQPLFTEKAEPTDYLKGVMTFLQDYQVQLERTAAFLGTLRELDLLTDVSPTFNLAGGERFSFSGLMMVDERKLQALPEAAAARMLRTGELAWVYSHLISIGNLPRLLNMAAPAAASEKAPAAAAKPAAPKPPSSSAKPSPRSPRSS